MFIDFSQKIDINKKEVLRYLEYKGQEIDDNLNNIIDECIKLTQSEINPRYILRVYSILRDENCLNKDKLGIKGSDLTFKSKQLYNLLEHCSECIIVASTLGLEIEKLIKRHSYNELNKSIILDACATTAIEKVCDIIQDKVEKKLIKENKYITNRYSPGYGDLSIEKNRDIINILNCQNQIGLTITDSNIMIPRKSVIAIIGISKKETIRENKTCSNCPNNKNCKYKRERSLNECKRFY